MQGPQGRGTSSWGVISDMDHAPVSPLLLLWRDAGVPRDGTEVMRLGRGDAPCRGLCSTRRGLGVPLHVYERATADLGELGKRDPKNSIAGHTGRVNLGVTL